MGKASRWFRGLLGLKRSDPNPNPAHKPPTKKKWSFAKPHSQKDDWISNPALNDDDSSRHAIVVAAATAAVAEAAVAAAEAAAAVVKLTSTGGNGSAEGSGCVSHLSACVSQNGAGYGSREERAAVTIQSHFRAYLARRALRALKALVKLQALAKGYIFRKQFTEYLQQMQAVARAQARARAGRVLNSEGSNSSTKSSNFNHNSPATPEKFERMSKTAHLTKRNSSKSNGNIVYDPEKSHSIHSHRISRRISDRSWEQGPFVRIVPSTDDEKSDKILEMDTGRPHNITPKYRNIFHSSHLDDQCYYQTLSSPLKKFPHDHIEEGNNYFCTANSSPQYYSASSTGRAPFTPTKSDGSKSYGSVGYLDHPNYMAYTESSKAKVRSVSAPKQRPQYERSSSSVNRYSVHVFGNNDTRLNNNNHNNNNNINNAQKVSALHASFTSKDYLGSGRLDRLGMPVRDVLGFNGGHHWRRY